jgi:hypothetical protein
VKTITWHSLRSLKRAYKVERQRSKPETGDRPQETSRGPASARL